MSFRYHTHTQTANVFMTTLLVGYGACAAVHLFRRIATVVVRVRATVLVAE